MTSSRDYQIGIVIPNWRRPDLTFDALTNLSSAFEDITHRFVVVEDDAQTFIPSYATHRSAPLVVPVVSHIGVPAAINCGVATLLNQYDVTYIGIFNNDVRIGSESVKPLLKLARSSDVGVVGATTYDNEGRLQTAGMSVDSDLLYGVQHERNSLSGWVRKVDAVQGSLWVLRSDVWRIVGKLDEDFFYSWEDVDWCARAHAHGFTTIVSGEAVCTHMGTESLGGIEGYNPVVEYMLLRNMLHFFDSMGLSQAAHNLVQRWRTAYAITTFRHPGQPPPDLAKASQVIELAISDYFRGRRGRWPHELDVFQ